MGWAVVDSAKKHGVLEANVTWLAEAPDKIRASGSRKPRRRRQGADRSGGKAKANDEVFILLISHGKVRRQDGGVQSAGTDLTADDKALLQKFPTQNCGVREHGQFGGRLSPLAGPAWHHRNSHANGRGTQRDMVCRVLRAGARR